MKVLYTIRNFNNYKDVIDSIIIEGDSYSSIEYEFSSYLESPDIDLPSQFSVETILLDCIRIQQCKQIRSIDDEIYL